MQLFFGGRPLNSGEEMECSANVEELALNRRTKCSNSVMGKKANYMGARARELEKWGWKAGEVLLNMYLFLMIDKSEC